MQTGVILCVFDLDVSAYAFTLLVRYYDIYSNLILKKKTFWLRRKSQKLDLHHTESNLDVPIAISQFR